MVCPRIDRSTRARVLRRALLGCAVALLLSGGALSAAASSPVPIPLHSNSLWATTGENAPIGFRLFPADNPWNTDISALPVHPLSSSYLASIGLGTPVHADFGTVWNGAPNGIPYVLVPGTQPKVPITFYYADESDPGPYPIPPNPPIEGGPSGTGDRHILTLDVDNRLLYEVYDAHYNAALGRWEAGSGAIWDLDSNSLRPDGWTSADAAGLPMLPGLVRYDEVQAGEITHALRFTVSETQRAYVYPATHFASDSTDPSLPPMGLRVRLKAGYDISGFPSEVQVILRALKKYGMIVADNGGPLYVSGAPDPRWSDDALSAISQVQGSDFEVVQTGGAPPVEPVAPVVGTGSAVRVRSGRTLSRWGGFADPSGSAWTATVDWGDGRGPKALALTTDRRFLLRHRFAGQRTYPVVVRVTNDHGLTGTATLKVVVKGR